MRTLQAACLYRNVSGSAQFLAALFTCPLKDLSLLFFVLLFVLNLAFHIRILFSDMGNDKLTDKLVVQKVFEMHAAGDSAAKRGRFFNHSDRWALNILKTYSLESFSPIVMNKRGMKRKTTEEEDKLIVQKGREQFCAPVRVVLFHLNLPIYKKISRQTAGRRLREAGARTVIFPWCIEF